MGFATLFWVVCFVQDGTFKRCCKRRKGFPSERFKKNCLEAYVIIVVGLFDVDLSLLSKMEVFIKKTKCS